MAWIPLIAAAVSAAGSYAAARASKGKKGKHQQIPTLTPEQQALQGQAVQAGMQPGAGGAFGTAADYYRNLLSNRPEDYQSFAAPEMRRFREEIIPQLGEQFAGMGAGGLTSSGFRNAAVGAGTDLAERLGAIRAKIREQGAQGLFNVGQAGLGKQVENVYYNPTRPDQGISQGLGNAAIQFGSQALDEYRNRPQTAAPSTKGTTSPYGVSQRPQSNFQLPTFNPNLRQ